MKKALPVLLLILSYSMAYSQISREDITPLFKHLGTQSYEDAYKLSNELLEKFGTDTTYMMGVVRYAFLFSGAALISNGELEYDDVETDVNSSDLKGKFIAMAGHPTTTDTTQMAFNTNMLRILNGKAISSTTATNEDATSIYAFEHFEFTDSIDVDQYHGKNTRCSGILDTIQFNPNKSTIWIMRLSIKEAQIREI